MAKPMVCRCEDVTLKDFEEAIEKGHRDIESLKRYTGFGTGYCQGKSCMALSARILAEHGTKVTAPFTPRPPYHPVRFSDLAGLSEISEEDERSGRPPH